MTDSSKDIKRELQWLAQVFATRLQPANADKKSQGIPRAPKLQSKSYFAQFIKKYALADDDRLLLITALAPSLQPDFLENAIRTQLPNEGDFAQLGGIRSGNFRGFLPTGETVMFLLAGASIELRLKKWQWLRKESVLFKREILELKKPKSNNEPAQNGVLFISQKSIDEVLLGSAVAPAFSMEFPAKRLETNLGWQDLVLPNNVMQQLNQLKEWIETHEKLNEWGIGRKVKVGYRSLFYGPPGTGKTLAATLLGKFTNTEVFRVDLSMVVSKYIGETEKNLASLFKEAQNQNWILFFDEADALFGKRTSVRDAHDKYANQEVAYLLQRIEEFSGLVILATNIKGNIDDAFLRRFQSVIYFPIPGQKQRALLWQKAFEKVPDAPKNGQLIAWAKRHEITGSNILNAAHYACLRAAASGKKIDAKDVETGINNEILKEGKVM